MHLSHGKTTQKSHKLLPYSWSSQCLPTSEKCASIHQCCPVVCSDQQPAPWKTEVLPQSAKEKHTAAWRPLKESRINMCKSFALLTYSHYVNPVLCSGWQKFLPPPFWWQRYGNLQTLPKPTLKPTCANTYWIFESHAGRFPSFVSAPSGSSTVVSWDSDWPWLSHVLSSLPSSEGFSILKQKTHGY